MSIDLVLNMDAEETASQVKTDETSITTTEYINNKIGGGNQNFVTENLVVEEKGAPESELSNPAESNHEDNKKRYSRLKHIDDSDSDDEREQSTLPSDVNESLPVCKMQKKVALIDSDSESDNNKEESLPNSKPEIVQKPKRLAIFDSDSEDDIKSKESDEDAAQTADGNKTDNYSFNKKSKVISENNNYNEIYSRLSALCDPDTSEEESEVTCAPIEHESELPDVTRSAKSKLKRQTVKAPKKMTGKEAMEQKREILSGSSRRARERQVSLPYHKPKHRSLKEFLQNRPRFADALPKRAAQTRPSLAIKMSNEQLEAMSKNLEEREKKLEEFFKSESESEDETANEINNEDATEASSTMNLIENDLSRNELMNSDQTMHCDEQLELEQSNSITTGFVNPEQNQLNENEDAEQGNGEEQTTNSEELKESNVNEHPEKENITNSEENCLNTETGHVKNSLEVQFSLESENCNAGPTNLEEKKLNDLIAKYSDVEEIKGNEDEDCNSTEQTKIKSKLELIKDSLAQYKPKLSGNPNQVIDLDEGVTKPNEVTQLVERFMQHNTKKNHHKTKVHVDVISMVDGEIRKEILSVPVDLDEMESVAVIEKPGARLRKLQDELQTQMAQRRSELWKQKTLQHDKKITNDENDDKTESCDDPILDDDNECEFTESESEASDEELEQEKPRKKLAFADEEAEESDEQETDDVEVNEDEAPGKENPEGDDVIEENHEVDDGDDEIEENPEVVDGDDESEDTAQGEVKRKRKLKRIVQAFTDDSDEENESLSETIVAKKLEQKSKNAFDDSTDTWDDSGPPPNQPRSSHTPRREFSQTKSQLGFLTPVFHLTGLQNFNSGSKFLRESPLTPFDLNVPPSPLPTTQVLQKNLFDEAPNEEKTQSKVPSPTKTDTAQMKTSEEMTENTVPSTQDLLEICSGSFSPTKEGSINLPENNSVLGKASEAHTFLPESNSNETEASSQCIASTEYKSDGDNDDRIISQLLDEEELENFKKKFESPLVKPSQAPASVSSSKVSRFVFDSSDEETNDEIVQVKKKAKQKKLIFSDEEEEEEEEEDCSVLSEDDKTIEYDSEENEIESHHKENLKASDFVENEAELSESDWGGSADEDEKDMDELEFEQGDAEVFDENKVRSDLERIHMRRILDDDNREVRLLQELLLEDGELHGTGRQRQFKWRNIDSVSNDVDGVKEDESGVYLDEYADGENEEQWRKLRYQRELFLKKKMQNESQGNSDDETSVSYESQVFKLGQAAIRRSISQNTADNSEKSAEFNTVKQHHLLLVKRGSFLSRNDEVLTRLAEYSKVTSASTGAALKNSRKFVFKSVASTHETTGKEVTVGRKRKPSDGTPTAIKKLRLSDLSPAASARSEKGNRAKKLFGNW